MNRSVQILKWAFETLKEYLEQRKEEFESSL